MPPTHTKRKKKVVKVKAWALITKKGELMEYTQVMSEVLRKFYNSTKEYMVVECEITYTL